MLHLLRRHPFTVSAFFRHSLVLTYAFPPAILEPLLNPGLALDTWRDSAFLAIALVQTERLRPAFLPAAFGRDFFLSGYRIFVRRGSQRGLQILRSDTNRRAMVWAGNLLTHYHYQLCRAEFVPQGDAMLWRIRTPRAEADLDIVEHPGHTLRLPEGSPFATAGDARRYAGPLPLTYSYEPESRSLIAIRGLRREWKPRHARVAVRHATFFDRPPFRGAAPVLAAAFTVEAVPYQWTRGKRIPVEVS